MNGLSINKRLIVSLAFLPIALPVMAGGEGLDLTGIGHGTMLFRTDQSDIFLRAPAVRTDVDIRVTGFILRAEVSQRFENATDAWLEGVYVFPLPENAP